MREEFSVVLLILCKGINQQWVLISFIQKNQLNIKRGRLAFCSDTGLRKPVAHPTGEGRWLSCGVLVG